MGTEMGTHDRCMWGSYEANRAIRQAFAGSKAILAESDTVWGLFTPATKDGALTLNLLKKRHSKPYIVIMDSLERVKQTLVFPDNESLVAAQKGWPGPLTLLCMARKGQLLEAQSSDGVVGVRVPDHEPIRLLARQYGGLFSTSANISGELVPTHYEQIDSSIRGAVGGVIYNDATYVPFSLPSTIVDCTGPELKVVRHGAYRI